MRVLTAPGRRRRRRRGVAATEMALILPVMVLLVLGCVDFGRFAYNYIAVTNAARAGASYAVMNPYTAASRSAWEGQILAAARDEMVGQTGYDADGLAVVVTTPAAEANGLRRVRVTASHPFDMITSWPVLPNRVTMRGWAEMRSIR